MVDIFIVPAQLRQCFAIHWMNTNISGCVCSNSYCLQIDLSGHTLLCFFLLGWWSTCMLIASVSILVQVYPQKSKMARNCPKNRNSRGYILADRFIWTHTFFLLGWWSACKPWFSFCTSIHWKRAPDHFGLTLTHIDVFLMHFCATLHLSHCDILILQPTHDKWVFVCREGWGRLSALLVIMVTLGTEVQMVGDTKESIFRMLWYLSPAFSHHMHISHV